MKYSTDAGGKKARLTLHAGGPITIEEFEEKFSDISDQFEDSGVRLPAPSQGSVHSRVEQRDLATAHWLSAPLGWSSQSPFERSRARVSELR